MIRGWLGPFHKRKERKDDTGCDASALSGDKGERVVSVWSFRSWGVRFTLKGWLLLGVALVESGYDVGCDVE